MSTEFDCENSSGQELAGAVADYIEEHGWQRFDLGTDDGPVCLVGGIAAVCEGDPRRGCALLSGGYGLTDAPKAVVELAQALRPVLYRDAVEQPGRTVVRDDVLTFFNDHQASAQPVLKALREIEQKGKIDA